MRAHDGDRATWDAAVGRLSGATHSHLSGWHHVIGSVLGHEVIPLRALDAGGAWIGALPLVHVRSRFLGNFLISMPFLNAGGPIGSTEARAALVARARDEAQRRGCSLLELRNRYEGNEGLGPSTEKVTVELALPSDPAALLKGFHPKLRTNIRKPTKAGMELRFGAVEVPAFYRVFAENMRDLGTPVLPIAFFEAIAAAFPDSAIFSALHHEGRPVGCQCSFVFGESLEMVWGSTLRSSNAHKPSSYIHWAYMELAIKRGLRTFDFGRCTPDSGTHKFKQQWGGRDVPLPWGAWARHAGASRPSADRRLFQYAVKVWQRLPLGVANRLGPLVARALP